MTAAIAPSFGGRGLRASRRRSRRKGFRNPGSGRSLLVGLGLFAGAISVGYLAIAKYMVLDTSVGPVIATVDQGAGRGVHSGDVMALPIAFFGLLCLTASVAALGYGLKRRSTRRRWGAAF